MQEMLIAQSIGWKLIQLQRTGNTHYFGWSVRFSCKKVTQDVMKRWLTRLSLDLDRWDEQVNQARKSYYHLNNFTNRQLCVIRQFLSKAKSTSASPRSGIDARILAMLQSLAADISSEQIWRSTQIALQVISRRKDSGIAVTSSTTVLKDPQNEAMYDLPTEQCYFADGVAQEAAREHDDNEMDTYTYRRKRIDSQSEDELSISGFSLEYEESGLKMDYHATRKYFDKNPVAMLSQSTSEPHSSSACVGHAALDPEHGDDGVV